MSSYEIWNPEVMDGNRLPEPKFWRDWTGGLKHVLAGVRARPIFFLLSTLLIVWGNTTESDYTSIAYYVVELALIQFIGYRIMRSVWSHLHGTSVIAIEDRQERQDKYSQMVMSIKGLSRTVVVEVPVEISYAKLNAASSEQRDQMISDMISRMETVSNTSEDKHGIVACIAKPILDIEGVMVELRTNKALSDCPIIGASFSQTQKSKVESVARQFCQTAVGTSFRTSIVDRLELITQKEVAEAKRLSGDLQVIDFDAEPVEKSSKLFPAVEVRMFGTAFVYDLCTTVATLLLVVPGVWLSVRWSLAVVSTALHGVKRVTSFEESAQLVEGHFWRVFRYVYIWPFIMILGPTLFLISSAVFFGNADAQLTAFNICFGLFAAFVQLSMYPLLTYMYAYLRDQKSGLPQDAETVPLRIASDS